MAPAWFILSQQNLCGERLVMLLKVIDMVSRYREQEQLFYHRLEENSVYYFRIMKESRVNEELSQQYSFPFC